MKTAQFIKDVSENFTGKAYLYKLSERMKDYDGQEVDTDYVVSSAATGMGFETYLFPADEKGKVISWGELPGSIKGVCDTNVPLESLGYEII